MSTSECVETSEEQYAARRPKSLMLHGRARKTLAGGVTHDSRYQQPFPSYVVRARGSRKWDADGNEYIDYAMGHGALLLGHQHPDVVHALAEQVQKGTHYGACHELEVEWAELVTMLIPSAEKVRFTSSGTEATMMALRLARAYTGKDKFIKFQGHFHGWHDFITPSSRAPYQALQAGVPKDVLRNVEVLPPDIDAVRSALETDQNIAAVILEPTGASWSTVPLPGGFLAGLREITQEHGVVLIFDEVITGFRWSSGGIQKLAGVTPDLTTLAKILGGGLPGGAVAGRSDIMELLEFKGEPDWDNQRKIPHPGTFNANPLCAAAGVACLRLAANGEHQRKADEKAARLRAGMNEILTRLEVDGAAYGESSVFHLIVGVPCPARGSGDLANPGLAVDQWNKRSSPAIAKALGLNMIGEGVHLFSMGGLVSSAHNDEDVFRTLRAFENSLGCLRKQGLLPR